MGAKIRKYKVLFIILVLFWLSAFLYFRNQNPELQLSEIFISSLGLSIPRDFGLYGKFFFFVWPIFIETIIFGFLVSALLDRYNPIITARNLARHQRNHAIIVGYQHLGIRMVEFAILSKKKFVLIERKEQLVESLINKGKPVVVGDCIEYQTLLDANIKEASEIFILVKDLRACILCAERARDLNPKINIYVRMYDKDFTEYFVSSRINATSFNIAQWALEALNSWINKETGNIVVIGRDQLAEDIMKALYSENRTIYAFDPAIVVDFRREFSNITFFSNTVDRLESITTKVDLKTIKTIIICWKEDEEAFLAVYLTQQIKWKYPEIKIYVRMFDSELASILSNLGAEHFSSSEFAFKNLQKKMDRTSIFFDSD